ncbi:hypothetical protein ACHQM5_012772 [Ranunculus cassubicifolius]
MDPSKIFSIECIIFSNDEPAEMVDMCFSLGKSSKPKKTQRWLHWFEVFKLPTGSLTRCAKKPSIAASEYCRHLKPVIKRKAERINFTTDSSSELVNLRVRSEEAEGALRNLKILHEAKVMTPKS